MKMPTAESYSDPGHLVAPTDRHVEPSHVGCQVRGEEEHGVRDLLVGAAPAERRLRVLHVAASGVGVRLRVAVVAVVVTDGPAGGDLDAVRVTRLSKEV